MNELKKKLFLLFYKPISSDLNFTFIKVSYTYTGRFIDFQKIKSECKYLYN